LGIAARYAFQRLHLIDAAQASAVGRSPDELHAGGALGPDLQLRIGVPIAHHVVLSPLASFAALLRKEEGLHQATAIAFHPVLSVALSVGYAF
jgi:hypothetical protein